MTQKETAAMNALQAKLISPFVLAVALHGRKYGFGTNSSNVYAGCSLLQNLEERTKRQMGFWSLGFHDTQLVYDTVHCEWCTIVLTVLLLQPYLIETMYIIRTDHDSFKRIHKFSDTTCMLALCRLCLPELDFENIQRGNMTI